MLTGWIAPIERFLAAMGQMAMGLIQKQRILSYALCACILGMPNLFPGIIFAQTAHQEIQIKAGHRLALLICASCHVVARDQPSPPILKQPGPSFASIAGNRNITADSIRAFLQTTHSTTTPPFRMPNPELADYQESAIIAYLLSLRSRT